MSFSDLVSGAHCGPSNPLQNLGKRFGQDRSTQFDRNSSASPAPSSSAAGPSFRSHQAGAGPSSQPDFFHHNPQSLGAPHGSAAVPFDLHPLHAALPHAASAGPQPTYDLESSFRNATSTQAQRLPHIQPGNSAWASEYRSGAASRLATPRVYGPDQQLQQQQQQNVQQTQMHHQPNFSHLQPRYMGGMSGTMMGMGMQPHVGYPSTSQQLQRPANGTNALEGALAKVDSQQWDSAFTSYDAQSVGEREPVTGAQTDFAQRVTLQPEPQHEHPPTNAQDADELAQTAGRLVAQVEHETNDKFRQSNFLNLMRRIRDRQAGIQGTDIVDTPGGVATETAEVASNKGKARDMSGTTLPAMPTSQAEAMQANGGVMQGNMRAAASAQRFLSREEEDAAYREVNDLYDRDGAPGQSSRAEKSGESAAASSRAFVGDGGDVAARMREDDAEAAEFAKYQRFGAGIPGASMARWEERMLSDDEQARRDAQERQRSDTESQQDQEELDAWSREDFVGRRWEGSAGRGVANEAQVAEWDKLQEDWDQWIAGPTGLRLAGHAAQAPKSAASAPSYVFQESNPYVGTTRQHALHTAEAAQLPSDLRGVLEREAEVQADPSNAGAWLSLGVKQQENEREQLAIAALHRAIQLDPALKDAWLALAVSYTNESDRSAALEAIDRWIGASERYAGVVSAHRAEARRDQQSRKSVANMTAAERHADVIHTLIAMARHGSQQGEVDPDVQVALGVLFNASEEYDKAIDCFTAALSVRPDDWLLYNRLGATLSNSGRSDEAIGYYHHALNLRPDFVRCHFNLSISCLNLKMYRDAASHIFTALTLQASDEAAQQSLRDSDDLRGGVQDDMREAGLASAAEAAQRSVTSNSLWETLRVACELMERPDLAALCSTRDVSRFGPDAHAAFFGGGDDVDSAMLATES